MPKFDVINHSGRVVRTVEASGYRLVDGYFHFKNHAGLVLSIASSDVYIIEAVADEK
ncbi:hypothetical protein [Glutamicibacter mishrai]|uniref:hypothetical protein n=1 Tax=Glutamicibacter mishrai TaxID=1775880 RepID=UPI003F7A5853